MKLMLHTVFLLVLPCSYCYASDDLGVPWTGISASLQAAEMRLDAVGALPSVMDCIGNDPDSCRWSAVDGIELFAKKGDDKLIRIEASWSNGRSGSSADSAAIFRSLCATIAAMVQPKWTKAQVMKTVAAIMVVAPSHKTEDYRDKRLPGVVLFGSRSVPSDADSPNQAFLQCGAAAVAE